MSEFRAITGEFLEIEIEDDLDREICRLFFELMLRRVKDADPETYNCGGCIYVI